MCGSGAAPASAGDGCDEDRERRMGEEDGGERGSMGRMGRMKCSQGRQLSQDLCLDSEKVGTPAVHKGSTGWSGNDSTGSRAAGVVAQERMVMD